MLCLIIAFFMWRIAVTKTAERVDLELKAQDQQIQKVIDGAAQSAKSYERQLAAKDDQIKSLSAELAEVNALIDARQLPAAPASDAAGVVLPPPPIVIPAP